jgi:tRNA-dependent cyclodipeptide synthase
MVKYKIKVKDGHDWRKHETASLSLSLGQPYHEGDKLQSTLFWINRNFCRCLIDVADTLQRYNAIVEHGFTNEEAMTFTRFQGDEWIKRNKRYLDELTIPYEIVRWEKWITHRDYPETRQKIGDIFNKNPIFRKAVEEEAGRFLERQNAKGMPKNKEQAFYENSILFLLEEVAGQMGTCCDRSNP